MNEFKYEFIVEPLVNERKLFRFKAYNKNTDIFEYETLIISKNMKDLAKLITYATNTFLKTLSEKDNLFTRFE